MGGQLERSSKAALKIGGAFAAVFVLLPGIVLALLMLLLAAQDTLIGHQVVLEVRLQLLSVALLAALVVIVFAAALRSSLRLGSLALLAVGLGGSACTYAGMRGLREATGVDDLITALSCGVAATGIMLLLGASLGIVARVRPAPPA